MEGPTGVKIAWLLDCRAWANRGGQLVGFKLGSKPRWLDCRNWDLPRRSAGLASS